MFGELILCATPIGNLEDITFRAINVLKEVDLIAAEDTRHTRKLLNAYEIHTPLTSYHEHNKYDKGNQLVKMLQEGKRIALVSDAGTPGISDPGEELVAMCYEVGIKVTALPGPVAGILALIISSLSTRRFVFEGFIPTTPKERKIIIKNLENETRTIIIYEAPHRLKRTLSDLLEGLGNRKVSLCKELTKKHENVFKTTLSEAVAFYLEEQPRGEYVIVIEGKELNEMLQQEQESWKELSIEQHMTYYIEQNIPKKDAMKKVAKDRGVSKREIYQYLIKEQ